MSKKEERLYDRAEWLYFENSTWSMWKALAVAVREEYQKQKERKTGKISIRQIGLLEYWD